MLDLQSSDHCGLMVKYRYYGGSWCAIWYWRLLQSTVGNSLNRPVIGERAMEKENQFTCFVPYSVLQFRTLTIGNLTTNKVQSHMLNEKPNMPQYISEATYSHHSWGCGSICKWTLLTIANPFPAVFTSVPRNHETYSFFFPPSWGVFSRGVRGFPSWYIRHILFQHSFFKNRWISQFNRICLMSSSNPVQHILFKSNSNLASTWLSKVPLKGRYPNSETLDVGQFLWSRGDTFEWDLYLEVVFWIGSITNKKSTWLAIFPETKNPG